MIRLPVQTRDGRRRGVMVWDAGRVEIEPGSLREDEVRAIRRTLLASRRVHALDVVAPGEDRPGPDYDIQGVTTPAEFLFHAGSLPGEGFRPVYQDATGDDLVDVT